MRNWFFLTAMFLAVGCEQSQTVHVCVSPDEDAEPTPIVWDSGDGKQYVDPETGIELRAGGAPCLSQYDCASAVCVPSTQEFSYCYSDDMDGCISVAKSSPYAAQCGSPSKRLYVCGDYDIGLLGPCAVVGTGALSEQYLCCNAP